MPNEIEELEVQGGMEGGDFAFNPVIYNGNMYYKWNISSPSKKLSKNSNDMVILYETKEEIDDKKAIYIDHIGGYFKKDDPRLVKDFMNPLRDIIIDNKYKFNTLYTNITNDGTLTDKKYTTYNLKNDFFIVFINHDFDLKECYTTINVINNPLFNKFYKEDLFNCVFFPINTNLASFVKHSKIKGIDYISRYKNDKDELLTFNKTLGKTYTYGVEIETISGKLPPYLSYNINYSSVHDGSLRHKDDGEAWGKEYVTGVLQGDQGLKHLKMLFNEISRRCLINYQCSNHFHIGGVSFSKENIVFMYYLYQIIQKEIFLYLPLSRRNNKYCRYLEYLDINISNLQPNNKDYKFYVDYIYSIIIQILTDKRCGKSIHNGKNGRINRKCDHPKGHKCNYDHSTPRYCWVNLIPALLNTRHNGVYTIEFRMVNGGSNYFKNKYWLLICMALVSVVENNKQYILNTPPSKITLRSLLKEVYGEKSKELIDFLDVQNSKYNTTEEKALRNEKMDYEEYLIDENLTIRSL